MAQVQMGLNQWGLPASAIFRKVQTLNDPGTYTGDRAKFHEWWTKMKVWIRAQETILTLNFDKCTAVWSRMEGPIAGCYTANRMNECTDRGIWPDWGILRDEVERHFSCHDHDRTYPYTPYPDLSTPIPSHLNHSRAPNAKPEPSDPLMSQQRTPEHSDSLASSQRIPDLTLIQPFLFLVSS